MNVSRTLRAAITAALLLQGLATTRAATLYWDAGITGGPNGGAGTWNTTTTSTNWWNGSANVVWADNSDAVFAGTAGTVSLPAGRTAGMLEFNTAGYVIDGGNSGAAKTLTVTGIAGTASATFQATGSTGIELTFSVASGTGNAKGNYGTAAGNQVRIVKNGAGKLVLDGTINSVRHTAANNSTVVVNGGTLQFGSGLAANNNDAGISLNNSGSTLDLNGRSVVFGRGVAGASDTLLTNSSPTQAILTLGGGKSYSFSISSRIAGPILVYHTSSSAAPNTLTLNNGANTYDGGTWIRFGTLAIGHDSALGTGVLGFGRRLGDGNADSNVAGIGVRSTDTSTRTVANNIETRGGGTMGTVFGTSTTGDLVFDGTFVLGANWTFKIDNANTTFNNTISAGSSVTKSGTGRLVFAGNNTYTGNTTINTGKLEINGTTSGQGNFTVNVGGVLAGTGTIGLAATKSVTVASGGVVEADLSAPGALTVGVKLDLSASGDILTLTGTAAGNRVVLRYTGSLVGTFDIVQNLPNGYAIDYATAGEIRLRQLPPAGTVITVR